MSNPATTSCPCGGATYRECCKPLHDGAPAPDAAALMRSRYSAYALGLDDYLLLSWHAETRPASVRFEPALRWLGLTIKRHMRHDDDHATVEFIARYRVGGGSAGRLHETSRFVREDGRWYYVDGVVTS